MVACHTSTEYLVIYYNYILVKRTEFSHVSLVLITRRVSLHHRHYLTRWLKVKDTEEQVKWTSEWCEREEKVKWSTLTRGRLSGNQCQEYGNVSGERHILRTIRNPIWQPTPLRNTGLAFRMARCDSPCTTNATDHTVHELHHSGPGAKGTVRGEGTGSEPVRLEPRVRSLHIRNDRHRFVLFI